MNYFSAGLGAVLSAWAESCAKWLLKSAGSGVVLAFASAGAVVLGLCWSQKAAIQEDGLLTATALMSSGALQGRVWNETVAVAN